MNKILTSMDSYGATVDYVRAMHKAQTQEELVEAFNRSIVAIGFIGCAIGFNFKKDKKGNVISNDTYITMPKAWITHYMNNNFMEIDPLIQWCATKHLPATWQTIEENADKENPVFPKAKEFGLNDGCALPVNLSENVAIISGASHKHIDQTTYMIFNGLARYVGTKLHFFSNNLECPTLSKPVFDQRDMSILSLIHIGADSKRIENEIGLSRQAIYDRVHRMQNLTATNTKLGAARALHWLGII